MKNKFCLYQPDRSVKEVIGALSAFGTIEYQWRGCLWFIKTKLSYEQITALLPLRHADDHIMQVK